MRENSPERRHSPASASFPHLGNAGNTYYLSIISKFLFLTQLLPQRRNLAPQVFLHKNAFGTVQQAVSQVYNLLLWKHFLNHKTYCFALNNLYCLLKQAWGSLNFNGFWTHIHVIYLFFFSNCCLIWLIHIPNCGQQLPATFAAASYFSKF